MRRKATLGLVPVMGAILLASGSAGMTPAVGAEPSPGPGQHAQPSVEAGGYQYLLFMPRAADDKRIWPAMVFLHGSGERGDEIDRVKNHGPPKHAGLDPDFPFILISPQLPSGEDWDIGKLEAILDHALDTLPIDPSRLYLTGLSRGGHATWRWGAHSPDRFAALAPVAGTGDPESACRLVDTPVWALHGDRDDVVPPEGSFVMARAIRKCGGRLSRLTIYPDLGHNAWDPAYADPALYLWLLSQRRPAGE